MHFWGCGEALMLSNVVRARTKNFITQQGMKEKQETNLFDDEGDVGRLRSRLSDKIERWIMDAPPLASEVTEPSSSSNASQPHVDTTDSIIALLEMVNGLLQRQVPEEDPSAPPSSLAEYSSRIRHLTAAARGMKTAVAPLF